MSKQYKIILNSLIVILVLMALGIGIDVRAAEDETVYSSGPFQYHTHDGYVSLCGYVGSETDVTIPSSIAGKPVSEIEVGAFARGENVETITVPDTVMIVDEQAFDGAFSLKKITNYSIVTIEVDGVEVDNVNPLEIKPGDMTGNTTEETSDAKEQTSTAGGTSVTTESGAGGTTETVEVLTTELAAGATTESTDVGTTENVVGTTTEIATESSTIVTADGEVVENVNINIDDIAADENGSGDVSSDSSSSGNMNSDNKTTETEMEKDENAKSNVAWVIIIVIIVLLAVVAGFVIKSKKNIYNNN